MSIALTCWRHPGFYSDGQVRITERTVNGAAVWTEAWLSSLLWKYAHMRHCLSWECWCTPWREWGLLSIGKPFRSLNSPTDNSDTREDVPRTKNSLFSLIHTQFSHQTQPGSKLLWSFLLGQPCPQCSLLSLKLWYLQSEPLHDN